VEHEVDTSLIDALLALSPEQRILQNDNVLRMIEEIRDGLARAAHDSERSRDERR
jgi:hypothetical protein